MDTLLDSRPDHIRAATVIVDLGDFLPKALAATDRPAAPKHIQLSRALVRALDEGIVREGDKLPSESDLTEMTPYSLGTVQKAVKGLMQSGFVMRRPGIGTIVKPWRKRLTEPLHCRFTNKEGDYLPVYPSILNRTLVTDAGPWSVVLGETSQIFRIDRCLRMDDEFSVFSHFFVDIDRYPIFETLQIKDFESNNFKKLMYAQSGDPISQLRQSLTFVPASAEIAGHIGVEEKTSVLLFKVTVRTSSDDTLYYQELYIPPNNFDLHIDSHLDGLVSP
ncbi:GntR family transcriptional regulator [Sneathiella sp.]|uniref:GntR family transcriptional regulator n=1 Tax=Sneathiella sp. TaxID=1964365 RepID=UPI003561FACC